MTAGGTGASPATAPRPDEGPATTAGRDGGNAHRDEGPSRPAGQDDGGGRRGGWASLAATLRRLGGRAWRHGRRVPPALWSRATGRSPGPGRPTAAFLRRRMLVLPALALIALALCAAAYNDVHRRSEQLRDRSVPALVGLAQARTSLGLAQAQAELRLLNAEHAGLVELGETYRSHLTEATQSLNRVAQSGALSKGQEQELRVVSGLVVAYGDKIAWADRNRTSRVLREAGVAYAAGMLRSPQPAGGAQEPTTVLDRIEVLEEQLLDESADLAAWSPLTQAAAAAAALVAVAFAFAVVGTSVFLRDRLRLVSVQIVAASVPVLLTPALLTVGGAQEHAAQADVHHAVAQLEYVTAVSGVGRDIERVATDAAARMRSAHPDGWALTAGIAMPATGLGALACGVTLYLYARPYPPHVARRKDSDA
ncbi:hypothetical protein ACF08N_24595 [Streptomyces sp. NPDC015127]|uniref:hypothetical protein n=1 Tax=Streptomyces sp. NPDC015127 TaxID=3364939 RepID=UPI0036FC7DF3